ncbi:Pr6Pr family membrane protein [Pseudotabrizicola algicola]|uniref:FAR-17a/AIG1-like protein n=1 Tax=Pseudotabrizicola algicola TaxID=2709381 RepID=A0A6B3RIT7_9RHOB|nr:Pr6Pr family membrane protein [Pseudotabrizicola algicola]NEX45930.1 hypothetical protein [Pseudotabrizicola algicola]
MMQIEGMRQASPLSPRLSAVVIFVVAALSLRLQFDANLAAGRGDTVAQVLWGMARFFTILTNFAVAVAMALVAMRWRIPAGLAFAGVLAIVMVGLVYHGLLARLANPVGLAWWADIGLHTAVPLMVLAWWLAYGPVPKWRALAGGMVWPLVYVIYVAFRGVTEGRWPYPFLNVTRHGWDGVAINCAGMVVAFAAVGAVLIAVKRRLG